MCLSTICSSVVVHPRATRSWNHSEYITAHVMVQNSLLQRVKNRRVGTSGSHISQSVWEILNPTSCTICSIYWILFASDFVKRLGLESAGYKVDGKERNLSPITRCGLFSRSSLYITQEWEVQRQDLLLAIHKSSPFYAWQLIQDTQVKLENGLMGTQQRK